MWGVVVVVVLGLGVWGVVCWGGLVGAARCGRRARRAGAALAATRGCAGPAGGGAPGLAGPRP
eukprot:COSAG02_NODE_61710_length_268_cov_0.497041_1_plen_62_part_01